MWVTGVQTCALPICGGPSVLSSNGSQMQSDPGIVLEICNLTLSTPRGGNILITDFSMELKDKDHLLVWFSLSLASCTISSVENTYDIWLI